MRKLVVTSSIIVAVSATQIAYAKTGDINFTGSLTAVTCSITGGNGGATGNNINVKMGTVSIRDLGDGTSGNFGAETGINLDIDCTGATGLTAAVMSFAPRSGSGVVSSDTRLLQLATGAGTATGVGIAIIDGANNIIDLGNAATIKTPLTAGTDDAATAKFKMRAAYIKTATTPTAGTANATMPFTIAYE